MGAKVIAVRVVSRMITVTLLGLLSGDRDLPRRPLFLLGSSAVSSAFRLSGVLEVSLGMSDGVPLDCWLAGAETLMCAKVHRSPLLHVHSW